MPEPIYEAEGPAVGCETLDAWAAFQASPFAPSQDTQLHVGDIAAYHCASIMFGEYSLVRVQGPLALMRRRFNGQGGDTLAWYRRSAFKNAAGVSP